MTFIHRRKDWPNWSWDIGALSTILGEVRNRQGRLYGKMASLGFKMKAEANIMTLTSDVVKSSAIEGQILKQDEVRSSIARRLGIDIGGLVPVPRDVEGIVEMMLDATQRFEKPLSTDRLFGWHAALFPTARSGIQKITAGAWRLDQDGPMQVVSGAIGHERVHFEAPAAKLLDFEMMRFLKWFNSLQPMDPVIKAALAHLWFITIHPFDDGNGRIARTIADLALARADQSRERFYSMTSQIEIERKQYYFCLERQQRNTLEITPWMKWFLECLKRAINRAEETLAGVLQKTKIWEKINIKPVSERQRNIINHLMDGFEGKLTTTKYAKISKCSQDTALRDIHELIDRGILIQNSGGGRNTSYRLADVQHEKGILLP